MNKLQVGDKAPDFVLPDTSGNEVSLKDYSGSWLVLYFYPKDDTPGCTTQACSLRDVRDEIAELGAEIIGVSRDSVSDHEKFKTKYNLNFHLLSDENKQAIDAYEAWGKKQFGVEGILRKTYLIDPGGVIRKIYKRAIPLGHGSKVVSDLVGLQSET